jgi:hypothetical protein
MTKLCLILVYFGQWPTYFELFKKSVARNSTIDFLCVTDNVADAGTDPENFTRVIMSMGEFAELASEKLGLPIHIDAPYKVCDLRPMCGKIFADHLTGYDFWGHCDCDLVFGDVRKFLTDNLFALFDKVLISGHLSLYRNNKIGNELFQLGEGETDWRNVLMKKHNVGFDEWAGVFKICRANGTRYFHNTDIAADICIPSDRYKITTDRFKKTNRPEVYYLQDGSIFRSDDDQIHEFAYIHLQKRRLTAPSAATMSSERIYFTPTGFLGGEDRHLSKAEMERINPVAPPDSLGIWQRLSHRISGVARPTGAT